MLEQSAPMTQLCPSFYSDSQCWGKRHVGAYWMQQHKYMKRMSDPCWCLLGGRHDTTAADSPEPWQDKPACWCSVQRLCLQWWLALRGDAVQLPSLPDGTIIARCASCQILLCEWWLYDFWYRRIYHLFLQKGDVSYLFSSQMFLGISKKGKSKRSNNM